MNSANILSLNSTVQDAIRVLDKEIYKFVCIVDEKNVLKGIFTQGDMRKYLLDNGEITAPIAHAMNADPFVFSSRREAIQIAKEKYLVVYPIVNDNNVLMDFYVCGNENAQILAGKPLEGIPLVIMAGGKGTRLYPYTKILPKALIPIGDLTICERIINQFTRWGCKDIYLILNYKAGMIRAYFEELDKNYNIHYVEETKFLGTGGGLSLLKGMINSTFILSNCDVLVDADYDCVLKTHINSKNVITFITAMKDVVIPYGIISTSSDGQIVNMEEKPELSFLTNTGVYIVEPYVIDELQEDEFIHITDIAARYLSKNKPVGAFPISGKAWLDMGQFSEMETMLKELGIDEKYK